MTWQPDLPLRDEWFLYVLRCKDGSIYVGITKKLKRRLRKHSRTGGSEWTKARGTEEILYSKSLGNVSYGRARYIERLTAGAIASTTDVDVSTGLVQKPELAELLQ